MPNLTFWKFNKLNLHHVSCVKRQLISANVIPKLTS